MNDPTLQNLYSLAPDVREAAYELVSAARRSGIPLMIISGRRTPEVNESVGGAARSWHLSGRAIDVQVLGYTKNQIPRNWWASLGQWAETNVGLRWGGRFNDVNHFDWPI